MPAVGTGFGREGAQTSIQERTGETPAQLRAARQASAKAPGIGAHRRDTALRRSFLRSVYNQGIVGNYVREYGKTSVTRNQIRSLAVEAGLDPNFAEIPLRRLATTNGGMAGFLVAMNDPGSEYAGNGVGLLNRSLRNIEDLRHAPGGLLHTGIAAVQDATTLGARVPGALGLKESAEGQRLANQHLQTPGIVEAMGKGMWHDIRHPLSNPVNTLLDLSAVASAGVGTAARGSAAARAASEAEGLGKAGAFVKALTRKPVPNARTITGPGDLSVAPVESGNPAARLAQSAYDNFLSAHPNSALTQGRIAKELNLRARHETNVARAPAGTMTALGKSLTAPEQRAIQVVSEGFPIDERIAAHRQRLAEERIKTKSEQNPKLLRSLPREIRLLERAKSFVSEVDGKPVFSDQHRAKLEAAQGLVSSVTKRGTANAVDAGLISPEAALIRPHLPLRALSGDPTALTEGGYIPHVPYGGTGKRTETGMGSYKLGKSPKPDAAKKWKGSLLASGNLTSDVTGAVAKTYLSSERWIAKDRLRKMVLPAGKSFTPDTLPSDWMDKYLPVRRSGKLNLPPELKRIEDKEIAGQQLTAGEQEQLQHFEQLHQGYWFPNPSELRTTADWQNVKFVPKRLVSRVTESGGHFGTGPQADWIRLGMKTFKALNNLERIGVLFTGPKYIIQNLPQNLAMTIIQQGPKRAIANYKWALKAKSKLSPEAYSMARGVMGEGPVSALSGSGAGKIAKLSQEFSARFGAVTDLGSRLSALKHEASRLGYRTDARFEKLLLDPKHAEDLYRAQRKATDAVGDFGRLGSVERALRDVVWFYPWLKVATKWTQHTAVEHPIQTAIAAEAGKEQAPKDYAQLGDLPWWMQGSFKLGGRVVNPNFFNIASTPMDVGAALLGAGGEDPTSLFTPGATLLKDLVVPPAHGSRAGQIEKDLYSNLPAVTLGERLTGNRQSKTYPGMTRNEAIGRFLVGSSFPTRPDIPYLNAQEDKKRRAGLSHVERANEDWATSAQNIVAGARLAGIQEIPPALTKALARERTWKVGLARALERAKPGDLTANKQLTQKAALRTEIRMALRLGLITRSTGYPVLRKLDSLDDATIRAARAELRDLFGAGDVSEARGELKSAGYSAR